MPLNIALTLASPNMSSWIDRLANFLARMACSELDPHVLKGFQGLEDIPHRSLVHSMNEHWPWELIPLIRGIAPS